MSSDPLGNPFSAAPDTALECYAEALEQFHCFRGDPLAASEALIAAQPDFAMASLLHAWLVLLGTEPQAPALARQDLERVAALPLRAREQGHVEAIRAFATGHWRRAGRILEDLSLEYPRDGLALQAGHLIDYYRGDARMLRDRLARVLPHWPSGDPGTHAVLAMLAFGCEETGDLRRAEALGRRALELEPRNAWAHHAVAHVFTTEGRAADGIRWMRERHSWWTDDCFFAIHNWWHLALFYLELGEIEAALALFDGPIHGERSTVTVDLIDASALLWRLELLGVDVGERWRSLAELWRQVAVPGLYAFNDFHAAMAWIGAGDRSRTQQWIAAQTGQDPEQTGDGAAIAAAVGAPLLQAFAAFAEGDHGAAIAALRDVRPSAHHVGGSHAQRDLIDLTLLAAARRAGQQTLAEALGAERAFARAAERHQLGGIRS